MNVSNQKPKPPPQDQMALGILKNVPLIHDGNGVYVDAAAKGYRNRLMLVPSEDFIEWLSGQVYTTYNAILDLNIVKKLIPLIRCRCINPKIFQAAQRKPDPISFEPSQPSQFLSIAA